MLLEQAFLCFSIRHTVEVFLGQHLALTTAIRCVPESVCEGFFVKNICRTTSHLHHHIVTSAHLHMHIYISAHLHICLHLYLSAQLHICASTSLHIFYVCTSLHSAHLHICASTSLLIFTSAYLQLCSSSHLHICASTSTSSHLRISHLHLSLFFSFSLKAGAAPSEHHETQPSAETARVKGAKCR